MLLYFCKSESVASWLTRLTSTSNSCNDSPLHWLFNFNWHPYTFWRCPCQQCCSTATNTLVISILCAGIDLNRSAACPYNNSIILPACSVEVLNSIDYRGCIELNLIYTPGRAAIRHRKVTLTILSWSINFTDSRLLPSPRVLVLHFYHYLYLIQLFPYHHWRPDQASPDQLLACWRRHHQ